MTQRTFGFLLLVASLALVPACGDGEDPGPDDGGPGLDAASIDAATGTPDAETLVDGAVADTDGGPGGDDAAVASDGGSSGDAAGDPDAHVASDAGASSDCGGCSAAEYCDMCPTMLGCVTRPADMGSICPGVFKPVCGCDGRTYSNGCFLASAGIPPLRDGACEDVASE